MVITEKIAKKRNMKKIEYYIATLGDDLDYTSYVYNNEGDMLGHLNWGFSENFYPSEDEIISFILTNNNYPYLLK